MENVYSVEVWGNGSWRTIKDGTGIEDRAVALAMARRLTAQGERVSIAEYTRDEGTSAIARAEIE